MDTLTVIGIKDFSLSSDGKQATFALITKYAGDIAIALPADCLKALQAPTKGAAAPPAGNGGAPKGVPVSVPKKWGIAADVKNRGLVLIFDQGTPQQVGFALAPKAAKELAAGLVQNADAVLAGQPDKPQ